jgi:hypothetical protein
VSAHLIPETQSHLEPQRTQQRSDPQDSARRRWWKLGLLIGMVAMLVSAAALIRGAILSQETNSRLTHTVMRGDLVVTVIEQGTLESSKNTEIKRNVRDGYGGRGGDSTVTWVIPVGTVVQPGDELVRLDTKVIEETISLGRTDTKWSRKSLPSRKPRRK